MGSTAPNLGLALVGWGALCLLAAAQPSYGTPMRVPSSSYSPSSDTPHLACAHGVVPRGNDYYTAPELLDHVGPAECAGYPRGFKSYGGPFGAPSGPLATVTKFYGRFDTVCQYAPRGKGTDVSSFYSDQYKMSVYKRGQRVCLIWPSKLRRSMQGTYSTTLNMPDGGLYVLRSKKNPGSDDTLSALLEHQVGGFSTPREDRIVAYLGKSQFGVDDMKGYSNCPMYGQNDRLMGSGASSDRMGIDACGQCFIVPYDLEPGMYTFYWYWRADEPVDGHSGGLPEEYISCFDVRIEEDHVDECPLAGDNGNYPGNLPGTGRHSGAYKPTGYTTGGPIVPSSVVPCDDRPTPPPPKVVEAPPQPSSPTPAAPQGTPSFQVTTTPASPRVSPREPTPIPSADPVPAPAPAPAPTPTPPPSDAGPEPSEPVDAEPPAEMAMCFDQSGAEYGGDVVGAPLEVDSMGECCAACEATAGGSPSETCNTYTYCPPGSDPDECTPRQCVLKNSRAARPAVTSVNIFNSGTNCLTNPEGCTNPEPDECKVDNATSRPGAGSTFNDASVLVVMAPSTCCSLCQRTPGCRSWACDGRNGGCALKMTVPQQVAIPEDRAFFSGVVDREGVSEEILNVVLPSDTPCEVEPGVDFPGNDIEVLTTRDEQECCRVCFDHFSGGENSIPDCFAWTYNTESGECSLKNKISERTRGNELLVGATTF